MFIYQPTRRNIVGNLALQPATDVFNKTEQQKSQITILIFKVGVKTRCINYY